MQQAYNELAQGLTANNNTRKDSDSFLQIKKIPGTDVYELYEDNSSHYINFGDSEPKASNFCSKL